jgi:antitoxin (DNA-binding transcriptional repressor) of toxin-antitoxin stability system
VTRSDYLEAIMKVVRIADLKARLSEHLREVRRGRTITVLDRDTSIARLVPYDSDSRRLRVRAPRRRHRSIQRVPLPPPLRSNLDIVDLLLEERQAER